MADRMSESERRALADSNHDVVADSGTAVEGRKLGQVVSLRFEPEVLATLRDIANKRGMTVSDLLRRGASWVIEESQGQMQISNLSLTAYRGSTGAMTLAGYSTNFGTLEPVGDAWTSRTAA